jgi:FkbM family methyltransferase
MDKVALLENLERLAHKLRKLGLHPVTRLGRHLLSILLRDITIQVDDLFLTGSIRHRGYLSSLRQGKREAYMTHLFKAMLQPGMVVCDIGSYIGYYALLAAQRVGNSGRVFAFEPDPHNFAYLSRNIRANGLDGIIVAVQKAVSDQSGCRPFYIHEGDRSRSSLFWREGNVREMTVECVRLDEFIDEFFGDETRGVDLVKMDIEGGELQALKGMERTLASSPSMVMFVECNPKVLRAAGGDARQLVEILENYGFVVQVIDEQDMRLKTVTSEIETAKYVNLFCKRGDLYARRESDVSNR